METIHLQSIGEMEAIPAGQLKVGDITIWNFGYKERIEKITLAKSGASAYFDIVCLNSGYKGTRRMQLTRLVAIEK